MEEDIIKLRSDLEKLKLRLHEQNLLLENDVTQDYEIDKLQKEVNKVLLDINTLIVRLDSKDSIVDTLTNELTTVSNDLNSLRVTYNNTSADVSNELIGIVSDIESSVSDITTINNLLVDQDGNIQGQSILINEVSSSVKIIDSEVVASASRIDSIEVEVNRVNGELIDEALITLTERDANVTKFSTIEANIDGLSGLTAANASATSAIGARTTATEDSLEATVFDVSALTARVGTAEGDIVLERDIRVSENATSVSRIETLEADYSNLNADYQNKIVLFTDADTANAENTSNLSTTIGTNTASISTISTSVDGIELNYSVKLDNNGVVSGFGLLSNDRTYDPDPLQDPLDPATEPGTSKFWIRADTFAVTNPNFGTTHAPFKVVDGEVFMDTAFIEVASITNAMIGDIIESSNFSDTAFTGWQLDKNGNIKSYGSLEIRDNTGELVLQSGGNIDWDNITNLMGNKPVDFADVTSANTSLNTANVGSALAADVADVVTNFDNRNDRNANAISDPAIATDGTAIDHIINTDGSADISFEWSWAGNNNDIDGFFIGIRSSTSSTTYSFGTTPTEEIVVQVPSDRRAHGFLGIAADKYTTVFVRAFRVVDTDISPTGLILSSLIQPTLAAENPYQAKSNIAFLGDLIGTIEGSPIGALSKKDAVSYVEINGTKPPSNADVTNYDDSRVSNVVEENNVLTVRRPVGGSYSNENSYVTGIIKIILPVLWTDTMLSFSVDVYNYLTDTSFTLLLGGYGNNSQSRWFNTSAILSGNIGANNHVRFGDDGTNSVIYIGDIGTVWQYPKVTVRDFQGGFNGFTRANWESGWSIVLENNETNFTLSPGGNYSNALLDAKAISNQGSLATKSSVDLNSSEVANKSLANLDPTQNNKLVNIQDNATKGATWATDITGQPSDTQLLNSNTTPADIGYTGDLDANKTTNTNQLTDGAGLGTTATWTSVASRPTNLLELNSTEGTKLTGIADGADVANVIEENNTLFINRPGGASFGANGDITGAIKIKLPQSWTDTMLRFTVSVYNYIASSSFTLELGGYTNNSGAKWINTSAVLIGATGSNNRVRFGHDGDTCAVYIGDTTTIWNNPKIIVKDFQASFTNYTKAQWESGWNVSVTTTIGTISSGADYADALLDAKSIKNQGTLATKNNVDLATTDVSNKSLANVDSAANSKLITIATNADVTSENTALNVIGQTAFATLDKIKKSNIGTYVALLAVQEAYIDDLAVSTLKIQGQAVTLPISVQGAASVSLGTDFAFVDLATAIITVPAGIGDMKIAVLATSHAAGQFYNGDSNITWKWQNEYKVTRNGNDVGVSIAQVTDQAVISFTEVLPAGTYTYIFKGKNVTYFNPFTPVTLIPSITLLGTKR